MNITSCDKTNGDYRILKYEFNLQSDTEKKYQASIWYSTEDGKFIDWIILYQDGSTVPSDEEDEILVYLDENWYSLTR